jgi:hypothetical protein
MGNMQRGQGSGREGYHDPTAGLGGAAPARSALTLRLVLAGFGLVVCGVLSVLSMVGGHPVIAILPGVLAVVAAVDIAVIVHRKRRGEPG